MIGGLGLTAAEYELARALDGDGESLDALVRLDPDGELAALHRAGPLLCLQSSEQGYEPPASWQRQLHGAAAHFLRLQATAEDAGAVLGAAGVDWTPLKGYDLATRLYGAPEERPTADLDLLTPIHRFPEAEDALRDAGWRGLYEGQRQRAFLRDEGYAWMARKEPHVLLELHFRLWGLVPEGFETAIFERSRPDDGLPPGGRRLTFADAYLVAAVHAWSTPPPRHLLTWWDLARIAVKLDAKDVDAAVDEARHFDLELPVALSAAVSAELFGRPACRQIAERLCSTLRFAERRLPVRADLPLARVQLARLLSGRRGRQGPRGAWRRIWPHPGIVERSTPEGRPWILRRLTYQVERLRPPRP